MKWEDFKEAREKSMNRFMDARQTDIECPECGKKIYVRTNITVATYPPKSFYFCECGWSGTA